MKVSWKQPTIFAVLDRHQLPVVGVGIDRRQALGRRPVSTRPASRARPKHVVGEHGDDGRQVARDRVADHQSSGLRS